MRCLLCSFKEAFIILVIILANGFARAQEFDNILIQNALLIDRTGQSEDRIVNLLIKGKKLIIVSADEIFIEDGMIAYDANNGILLGNLNIGDPANFMILSKDPRTDIDVLLDTKTNVIFAIRDGTIARNALTLITDSESTPKEKKKIRWLAYTPPPMAMPLSYDDKSKWNRWETKPFSGIFVAAVAIDRQIWLGQNNSSEQQVGDLAGFEGGEIRAFRFGMAGTINFKKPWIYTFVVVTHAFDKGYDSKNSDKVTLFDYRLDIPLWETISLSVGKQKEPISMQRLLLGTQMQMQERSSIVDAVYPVRNVGVAVNGTGLNQRISWSTGLFNDWFDDSQSFKESSNQIVGRITGLALVNDDESNILHLGLGIRYDDAKEFIRYRASPEFNQSPPFIDTDTINASNTTTFDLEVTWRKGPFWLSSEYLWHHVDAADYGDPLFNGFFISGSWILTREMRGYNKRNGIIGPVPVSRSVYQGGTGAWEITARYSHSNFTDGLVQGGEMDIFSLGLNWWLTPAFGINLNYRYILLDRYDVLGRSSGIMGRVVLVLE